MFYQFRFGKPFNGNMDNPTQHVPRRIKVTKVNTFQVDKELREVNGFTAIYLNLLQLAGNLRKIYLNPLGNEGPQLCASSLQDYFCAVWVNPWESLWLTL